MREQGRLTAWNDDRGFGFITPLDGESRLFAHISEFPRQQRRPLLNDLVVYTPSQDDRGRPRATSVTYLIPTLERAVSAGNLDAMVELANLVKDEDRSRAIELLEQAASLGSRDAMVDLAILVVGEDRSRAIELFEQAANLGEFNAMNWLAYLIKDDDRLRAVELFEQAVKLGHTNAMVNLADLIVEEDRPRAEELLEQAASLRDPDAMVRLANQVVEEDLSRAIRLFEQSASLGNPVAMKELGILIVREDRNRAIRLFEQAAALGNATAMNWLAYLIKGDRRQRAVQLFEQAVTLGHTNAMVNLADLIVEEDRPRAEELLEQAASLGDPDAIVRLANLVVDENPSRAIELFEQAASSGDRVAMFKLATLIVGEDRSRAIELFEQAATLGEFNAMNWLAYLIKDDDRQRAIELFECAVALGHTDAMVNLANLIVEEDQARARGLLELAASHGYGLAKERLTQFRQDSRSLTEVPAEGKTQRVLIRAGLKRCPECGAQAVAKSLFSDDDYCFPKRGGCGAVIPNLTICADGLTRGLALEPYYRGSSRSFFGDVVNQLKYHSLSDAQKLALVNQAVTEIGKRAVVEELIKGARNLLVVPVPSSKNRSVQHVYEITKRVAASKYMYFEAVVKTTSTESKTMDRGSEYDDGDFRCDYALEGRSILLIDDTYGEGASLKACIRVLKDSGAGAIYFLSLCKNTRGGIKHSNDHPSAMFEDDIPF